MSDAPASGGPGTLYCVPTPIASDRAPDADLAPAAIALVARLDYVIAESAKTARAVLKRFPLERPIQAIEIVELSEHTRDDAIGPMLAPLRAGRSAALMSEAGCPGVADPGARLVLAAHAAGVPVVPIVGPSALLLALMGSGLNGQRFAFAGYLPTAADERRQRLRELEQRSRRDDETILFIETPYRNQPMFDALLASLAPSTWLCVAADLTGAQQSLQTRRVADWRRAPQVLAKVPTVFLLLGR
ncbi:MAG: SAM-dependent methyltransferase [Burkholderiales bacterium]|nr:MAG: SAM-dependent methyltransferase [Burkholderiales bacterium]